MLSLSLPKPGTIVREDVPIPALEPGDALLRVDALTLCGSDARVFTGQKTGGVTWPVVLGHEFAGTVVDSRGGAADQMVGTRRAVMPWIACLECDACIAGRTNLCQNADIFGYSIPGAMAEYVRIPARAVNNANLVPVADTVPATAAALTEPVSCVYHGHLRSKIEVGSDVLILGAGPIGQLHIMLAQLAGARTIIVSEPNPARRSAVPASPRIHAVDPTDTDLAALTGDVTGGRGVDVAIICAGKPTLVADAIACVRPAGLVNLFAGFGRDNLGSLDLNAIHYGQLAIIGGVDATLDEYRTSLDLITSGQIDAESLVSATYPLDEAETALKAAVAAAGLKVAIVPEHDGDDGAAHDGAQP